VILIEKFNILAITSKTEKVELTTASLKPKHFLLAYYPDFTKISMKFTVNSRNIQGQSLLKDAHPVLPG
jgi:hypothetical protein